MSLALNLPTEVIFHKNKTPKWILKEIAKPIFEPGDCVSEKSAFGCADRGILRARVQAVLCSKADFWRSFLGLDWKTANSPC